MNFFYFYKLHKNGSKKQINKQILNLILKPFNKNLFLEECDANWSIDLFSKKQQAK